MAKLKSVLALLVPAGASALGFWGRDSPSSITVFKTVIVTAAPVSLSDTVTVTQTITQPIHVPDEIGFKYGVTWTPGVPWSEWCTPPKTRCRGTGTPTCKPCGKEGPTSGCLAAQTAMTDSDAPWEEGDYEWQEFAYAPVLSGKENLPTEENMATIFERYEDKCEESLWANCRCHYD
jgi:hypothetical protein